MTYHRKIIHIDMDAFYASIEQHDHPEYRGKPLVVGFSEGRGVIAAASYEARTFGVHSAMPTKRALELCPNLIFAAPRFSRYREISQQIRQIFYRYTPLVEPLSLDEAYLDITYNLQNIDSSREVALKIKKEIEETLGLTASAGVSYNKFLAKIASDVKKPDGLFEITPESALPFLAELPIEKFFGVGRVTAQKMHKMGIEKGADLQKLEKSYLIEKFGKAGESYFYYAQGLDYRTVDPDQPQKSLGVEETFFNDLILKESVIEELEMIAQELIRRALKSQFIGRNCTLKLRYKDFTQISRSVTTHFPLGEDLTELWSVVLHLLEKIELNPNKGIRLIGLSITNIDLDKEILNCELNQRTLPLLL